MHDAYRECPQCGEAIEGRPNKIFCSNFCKGQHFRENNPPKISEDAPVSQQPVDVDTSFAPYRKVTGLNDDWQKQEDESQEDQEEAAQRMRAAEQAATKLHERFCAFVRAFLKAEGHLLTARHTNRLLQEGDELMAAYQAHPYLRRPGSQVSSRLKELYAIHDILQDVAQDIAGKILWQSKEGSFEVTRKSRNRLRELLISD